MINIFHVISILHILAEALTSFIEKHTHTHTHTHTRTHTHTLEGLFAIHIRGRHLIVSAITKRCIKIKNP